ncbi:transposase [Streptomyces noursei ATCC 11455]|nr:transposase [Streptomyces noursei ATCC 11455]
MASLRRWSVSLGSWRLSRIRVGAKGVVTGSAGCWPLCTVAVLGGAATLVSIARFAAGAPPEIRARLGLEGSVPRACTLGRLLSRIDTNALDRAVGNWLAGQLEPAGGLQALAVDGKSLRGSRTIARTAVHLLAAVLHGEKAVIAQRQVDVKSNEITAFQPLLAPLPLTGTVVTFDALLTQTDHARFLVEEKNAHYIAVVKGNHPTLQTALKELPWRDVPLLDKTRTTGHGRNEIRRLKAATVTGLAFPHAVQVLQIVRRRRDARTGKVTLERVYAVTSLAAGQATAAQLAALVRGHWEIEALHHIRDTTLREDACRVRTGNAPRALATFRNLAIALARLDGGRPGRGSSCKPSRRLAMKRARQRSTVDSSTPRSIAACRFVPPSAHRSTILARRARNCAVFARRDQRTSWPCSASLRTKSAFGRPVRPASCSPAIPSAANFRRHLPTVLAWTSTCLAAAAFDILNRPGLGGGSIPCKD